MITLHTILEMFRTDFSNPSTTTEQKVAIVRGYREIAFAMKKHHPELHQQFEALFVEHGFSPDEGENPSVARASS